MITLFLILALIATLLLAYEATILWLEIDTCGTKGLLTVGFTAFGLLSSSLIFAYSLFKEAVG